MTDFNLTVDSRKEEVLKSLLPDGDRYTALLAMSDLEYTLFEKKGYHFIGRGVTIDDDGHGYSFRIYDNGGEPLYTTPPKREPLSEEQACKVLMNKEWKGFLELVRQVEKAHGIGGGE